jgi:death-on-curing family protein
VARKVTTVSALAKAAQIDEDEALICLWDAGLERYKDPHDRLRRRDMEQALHAVGVPTRTDLTNPSYWVKRLELKDDVELRQILDAVGTPMSRQSRVLPRGAIAKLKRLVMHQHDVLVTAISSSPEETIRENLAWRTVGRKRQLRLLTTDEVLSVHWELVSDFAEYADPISPPGVRSQHLLESAVFRQHTGLGQDAKYPTAEMAGAALLHSIVHNHPFFNGNKRTGLVSMLVLLDENGLTMTCPEDDLFQFVLRLAQHKLVSTGADLSDRETLSAADWICSNSRNIEKGERPVQWRRLRQILKSYECEESRNEGNRLNILRVIEEKRFLGLRRRHTLSVQVRYSEDGREAAISTIKTIRRQLRLDEENGIDSFDFYGQGAPSPSAFIVRYGKILRRLAHL